MSEEKKKKRKRKLIAPIVVFIVFIIYLSMIVIGCFSSDTPLAIKVLFAIIPLSLGGVITYVVIERIDEINGGEEDDLSKY